MATYLAYKSVIHQKKLLINVFLNTYYFIEMQIKKIKNKFIWNRVPDISYRPLVWKLQYVLVSNVSGEGANVLNRFFQISRLIYFIGIKFLEGKLWDIL